MWTEKHRPETFDEVIGNQDIIQQIKSVIGPDMPHMLFTGRAGVGKTTVAKIIIEQLGVTSLELNASDERGISTIQGSVKEFAKTQGINSDFKIILLDEADSLTKDAQFALRRIMEIYHRNCKFILTCNNPAKIIEPIKSRCAVFEFQPIDKVSLTGRLHEILCKEQTSIDDDALDFLYKTSGGDFRKILNTLEPLHGQTITKEMIKKFLPKNHLKVLKYILDGDYPGACKTITNDDVLAMVDAIHRMQNLPAEIKSDAIIEIAEYDYRRQFAVTEEVQLYALVGKLIKILSKR